MKTRTRIAVAATLLVAMCIAGSADAALLALDDFSSGTNNGGTGWAGAWDTAMTFSTASPFNDNVTNGYLNDSGHTSPAGFRYSFRGLATPLLPGTTPEVWVGVYLRPTNMADWQFGFEVNGNVTEGAQAGKMFGDGSQTVMLARANAEARTGSGNTFTANQPTMLAMRLYKNNPGDSVYNRADLYADMNGNDGRYNNPVAIVTGLDLSNRSADDISRVRLLSDTSIDFDYVAVGTSLADVTNPAGGGDGDIPEPATMCALGLAVAGLGGYVRRRGKPA